MVTFTFTYQNLTKTTDSISAVENSEAAFVSEVFMLHPTTAAFYLQTICLTEQISL
jgi:hypothetical protein